MPGLRHFPPLGAVRPKVPCMRAKPATLALALVLLLGTGCSGSVSDPGDNHLMVGLADGPTYVTEDTPTVVCERTTSEGLARMVVSVPVDEAATSVLTLSFVTDLVDEGHSWTLPYSAGDEANEMLLLVTGTGATSSRRGSLGTVTINTADCEGDPELQAVFDATLASGASGAGPVTVEGEINHVVRGSAGDPSLGVE